MRPVDSALRPVERAAATWLNPLQAAAKRYRQWQEQWRDPILTALLVVLSLEVFVNIPLSRSHFFEAPVFAVGWLLLIVAAVLIAARHWIAIVAILLSSSLTVIA